MMRIWTTAFLVALAASGSPKAPLGWRHDGTGRYPGAEPPLEWSASTNIVWTTKIGPNKYSSPIVVDGKIFLVADPALLFCVDAGTGAILWQKSNGLEELQAPVPKRALGDAGNTTPTPASDGRSVYVVFGSGIVASYDLDGARRWIRHYPQKPATEYGRAASPVLAGGKLLVQFSCLLALDPATGAELWKNPEVPEGYGTPVPLTLGGVEAVLTPSGHAVRVADGKLLASGLGGLSFASPVVDGDAVYLMQAGASAQRLNVAAPDRWDAKPLWEQELDGTFYASALCDRGLIYAVSNLNLFYVLDAKDGKILVTQDLSLPEVPGAAPTAAPNLYPSLTLAGDRLFVFNDQGDARVLAPGREFKELKRNHLGEGHGGSPAFDGKRLYLRSGQNLYCIAAQ